MAKTPSNRQKKVYKKRISLKKPIVSKAVKKYVKGEVHRNIENKTECGNFDLTITSHNQLTNMNAISLIPYLNIAHGTFQGSKIGNEIRTRKLMLRMVVTMRPYELVYHTYCKPEIVQIFIGK